MKQKLLLSVILAALAGSAQAQLLSDYRAYNACQARFDNLNRAENLHLRTATVYRRSPVVGGSYHYFFNARNAQDQPYRVECQSRRIGKVVDFSIEPGSWVYGHQVEETYAGTR